MAESVPDLTGTSWRDDVWLQYYGLSPANVLDYISMSPFYDRTCNNEVAKLKGIQPEQLHILSPGIEYVLQDAQPPHLFVIRRQHRTSPTSAAPQALLTVLDGTVYQAPALHALLTGRLARCRHGVAAALAALQRDLHPLSADACVGTEPELQAELAAARAAEAQAAAEEGGPGPGAAPLPGGGATSAEAAQRAAASIRHVLAQFPLPTIRASALAEDGGPAPLGPGLEGARGGTPSTTV